MFTQVRGHCKLLLMTAIFKWMGPGHLGHHGHTVTSHVHMVTYIGHAHVRIQLPPSGVRTALESAMKPARARLHNVQV